VLKEQPTTKFAGGRQASGSIDNDEFEKLRENIVSFDLPEGINMDGNNNEEKKG